PAPASGAPAPSAVSNPQPSAPMTTPAATREGVLTPSTPAAKPMTKDEKKAADAAARLLRRGPHEGARRGMEARGRGAPEGRGRPQAGGSRPRNRQEDGRGACPPAEARPGARQA